MPNRILKESICESDSIDALSWFEEVLFYRLIVNCDDYGRFDGRTKIIKSSLFPLKDNLTLKNISEAINALASVGLVVLYEFEGKPYLYLPTWNDHQNVRAKRSKYPEPESGRMNMNTSENICNQMNADVPVIQSNPIQSVSVSESESEHALVRDPDVAAVVSAYLDRVNPAASPSSLEELSGYAKNLGKAVCLRAIDVAIDAKKATWPYIRGILRRLQGQGVTCLADWEANDAKRDAQKAATNGDGTASRSPSDPETIARMKALRDSLAEE